MDCFPSVLLPLARLARADVGTPKPRGDWASPRLTKEPRAGRRPFDILRRARSTSGTSRARMVSISHLLLASTAFSPTTY